MKLSAESLRALACPRCAGELRADGEAGLRCDGCRQAYPHVDGIPCLPPDPGLWRAQWRSRLDEYGAAMETRVETLRAEAALPSLLPRTRERVSRVAEAVAHERARVRAFTDILAAGSDPASARLPVRLSEEERRAVVECDEHVFRDWVWGRDEVDRLRAFTEKLMPEGAGTPGTLAVYGAGAGRLAVDAHRSLRPARTFAFDWNPLPLWAAERLLRGETLEIFELPLWPSRAADAVVLRKLAYAEAVPPGFSFLIADALEPPFAPGSVDVVLTCWFIDAVPADLRELVPRINRVLRPGGVWINAGPLRYKGAVSRSYTIDEVHDVVELGGFALGARAQEDLPYFAAPLGGTRALETVFGFAARKTAEAAPFQAGAVGPPWLADTSLPVPGTPAMVRVQQASIVAAGMISLVDGVRSITDITRVVADTWKMDPAEVEPQVKAFFATTEGES